MPQPSKKKARTDGETSQKTLVYSNPCNVEKEDDPENWDDVNEDSWGMEIDNISKVKSISNPVSQILQQKSKNYADNYPLHLMQAKMDRIRTAMNLARFSVKSNSLPLCASFDSTCIRNDSQIKFISSQVINHKKLTRLLGPLELKPPITPPTIMIRQGHVTARYIRDFNRDDTLELNDCYVFRRSKTLSFKSESNFCVNLARNPPNSQNEMISSSVSWKATLSDGNQIDIIPNLLGQINNHDDDYMVLLDTRKENILGVLNPLTIYFERRALFLENIVSRSIELTPLKEQPLTIQLILEFVDFYDLRKWRSDERTSRRNIVKDEKSMKWDVWKQSKEGFKVREMFEDYVIKTPLNLIPIVDTLFTYSCEYICKLYRRHQYYEDTMLRILNMNMVHRFPF